MQSGWQPACASLCPSSSQALLLRAAVGDASTASESFRAWKQATGFVHYSDIDFSSSRLLPAVHHNFLRHGITDSWSPQMGALHRYHWLQNTHAQRRLLEAIQYLTASNCQFVVVGGFSLLAAGYYADLGERPQLEPELLVSVADGATVHRALTRMGWHDSAAVPAPVTGWRAEWWRAPDGQTLRVHYRLLPKPFPVVRAEEVLRHSESIDWNGLRLRILDPADALTYACVANRRPARDDSHRFQWALAALRILGRTGDRLDWERLVVESKSRQTMFALRQSLGYLHCAFEIAIPELWHEASQNITSSTDGKQAFFRSTRLWSSLRGELAPSILRWPWSDYASSEKLAGRAPTIAGLLRYWRWHLMCEWTRARQRRASETTGPGQTCRQPSRAA